MPPKKVTLPDHIKDAVLDEVALDKEAAETADRRYKIRMYLATQQGAWQQDIAERLEVSTSAVSKWVREGRELVEARDRRGRERAQRSGEPEPVG